MTLLDKFIACNGGVGSHINQFQKLYERVYGKTLPGISRFTDPVLAGLHESLQIDQLLGRADIKREVTLLSRVRSYDATKAYDILFTGEEL